MMEMMQQVVHLRWQRKNKSCCVVFHFVSKDRGWMGKSKKRETRSKNQETRSENQEM
jgi:hypothetical protein